jgi:Siphovirus ReqiPepy6 Gp37-like protein
MEWYTLDDSLRRDSVIENYQSFIWTERYSAWGDFQIVTRSTFYNRSLLTPGTMIAMNGSYRVMTIETVKDDLASDGVKNITVTGRSLEAILDDRVAMPLINNLTATPKWICSGTPGAIARYIFDQVCVHGVLSANDTIPLFHEGTFLPPGSIAEPGTAYTMEFDPGTVYKNLLKICEIWPIGFRLVRNGDTGGLYFDVYTGSDRTSGQTVNPPVIFSPGIETMDKMSVLRSISARKNVAYVFAQNGAAIVYASGWDSSVSGLHRRVLVVSASDIDLAAGTPLNDAMAQRGLEELAKYRDVYAVDGEVPQHLPFVYGVDYSLGDLVEERTPDGYINEMLVTEQIFISDHEGERSYPTLVMSDVIAGGSWLARSATEHWDDVPSTQHWDDA